MAKKIKKNILITGGNGFLAGRYIDYFVKNNFRVYASSRTRKKSLYNNQVTFFNLKKDSYETIFKKISNIDYLLHTSGMDQNQCKKNEKLAFKINVDDTVRLANLANLYKVKLFIFLSSIHVYSSPLRGELSENNKVKNIIPYGKLKILAEKELKKISNKENTKFLILRLSNSFGRPAYKISNSWNLIINNMCKQVVKKSEIKLKTTGIQKRNFISITELCEITKFFTKKRIFNDLKNYEIFNIGNSKNHSLNEIVQIVVDRYSKLYKKNVIVRRSNVQEKTYLFNLKINKLLKLGYVSKNKMLLEIDSLLKYCKIFLR